MRQVYHSGRRGSINYLQGFDEYRQIVYNIKTKRTHNIGRRKGLRGLYEIRVRLTLSENIKS